MTRSSENRCFRRFQETRDPRLLGKVFDATAAELLRVAGHLSNGDRELTQDALQATFLTAIEKSDSYDTERDVRPWLLGILANHVRKERRRTVRQRGVDVSQAGLAATDSPVVDVQLAEFGSAALAAMKELPSPFREAIVLHLQHGLSAAEIGEALGRPAGTVRTQIVRGMDRLRALLPAGFTAAALGMMLTPGPILASVRSNVLATLPAVAVASSSFVLTGWRLYAMIAASVTVVLSVLSSLSSGPSVAPPAGVATADPQQVVERASVDSDLERELVAEGEPELPVVQVKPAPKAPIDPNLQRIALKVVYVGGKPAGNVPVGVFLNGGLKTWQTDARGRLNLYLPWPGLHEIYAIGTNERTYVSWNLGGRRPRVVKSRIEIKDGMTLDLKVVDAAGKPVAGATIESAHGFTAGRTMLTTIGKTDANGRFVRSHVPARKASVRVWADGYQPSPLQNVAGKIGEVAEKTLTLAKAGHRVRGTVVDEKGEPVANAQLALVQLRGRPKQPQFLIAGEDGTFEIGTLSGGRHVIVGMHHDKVMRRGQVRFAHDGRGTINVELRLTRGARIIGTLKSQTGQTWAGTNLVARDRPEAIHGLPFLETWTTSGAGGKFVMEGLLPGTYALESDHVETKVVTVAEGETHEWMPVRSALQPMSLRLLDSQGKPLSGWRVAVIPDGQNWIDAGMNTGPDGRLLESMTGFFFAPGTYCRLAMYKPQGKSDKPYADFGRIPSLITPPLIVGVEHEVHVPASANSLHRVTGQLVDSEGAPITKATVRIYGDLDGQFGPDAEVDATGTFRFEDIPAGRRHAYVSMPGRPKFSLPTVAVGPQPVMELGLIEIPATGRIIVTVPKAVAGSKGLRMQLTSASGHRKWLRKQDDGTWRSDILYHGNYEVTGRTGTTWAPPLKVVLMKPEVRADVAFVPHKASKLVVQLPHDYPRNSSAWSGDLKAHLNGRVVFEGSLNYGFGGLFQDRMEFSRSLPPGRLELEIVSWHKRKGYAKLTVPATGGGQVVIRIE